MPLSERIQSATTRLVSALALPGEALTLGALTFNALIDRFPKPDRLAMMNFDPASAGQVVTIQVLKTVLEKAPGQGAVITSPTERFRVIDADDLGHSWLVAVTSSKLSA